jgi:hypothetical protein
VPFLLTDQYKTYLDLWWKDTPIPQGVLVYDAFLKNPDFRCVFVTSRAEAARDTTLTQLSNLFDASSFELLMRPDDDHQTEDTVLKKALIEAAGISWSEVFIAFDDRPSIVEMYRSLGCVAYQTDKGY